MQGFDGFEDIAGVDRQQGRVGIGREDIATPPRGIGQDDVGPRGRAPHGGQSGTEQHYRGPRVRRSEMRGAGVGRDDQTRCGNDAGELVETRAPRQDAVAGKAGPPGRVDGPIPVAVAAGQYDAVPLLFERSGDGRETLYGPAPRAVRSTHVDHRGVIDEGGMPRSPQPEVKRIGLHSERPDQPRPALPLVQVVAPARKARLGVGIDAVDVVRHGDTRLQRIDQLTAACARAVQVDHHIDASGGQGQCLVESGNGQHLVDAADEVDDGREPPRRGQDQAMTRIGAAQPTQRRNGDKQVAEFEGPQHEQRGWHAATLPSRAPVVQGVSAAADTQAPARVRPVAAVLFDRDGTLVDDVPYNGDPDLVSLVPTALEAVRRLRRRGIRVGLISNQSGIGRGLLTHGQVAAVNRRLEEHLGVFDVCLYCPHAPEDGCHCRKPAPGLVLTACELLAIDPRQAVVVGDTEADVAAAEAAGGRGVLVPNPVTLPDEVRRARCVARDLAAAVDILLDEQRGSEQGESR